MACMIKELVRQHTNTAQLSGGSASKCSIARPGKQQNSCTALPAPMEPSAVNQDPFADIIKRSTNIIRANGGDGEKTAYAGAGTAVYGSSMQRWDAGGRASFEQNE
ncbi:putative clathrin assembly protein, partial [Cucurbita argyrosperma subsp. sororia]